MQIAFGRVRRKTEPTGPGTATVVISKIDTYGYGPAQSYILGFLLSIKYPIQRLIFLANRKIRIRYFGEVDIELVLIQQFRE